MPQLSTPVLEPATPATPGASDAFQQGQQGVLPGTPRRLLDKVSFKSESCFIDVIGAILRITSRKRGEVARMSVFEIVAQFERSKSGVICALQRWEIMFATGTGYSESIPEEVVDNSVWKLEMSVSDASSFRRQVRKLGVVHTDFSSIWKLTKYLGEGAFAEVYLGKHMTTEEYVAAKVMKKPLYPQDSKVARKVWHEFTREIHILAMAQGHEGVPKLYATFLVRTKAHKAAEEYSNLTMITEYLEISLGELLMKHGGTFPEAVTKGVTESLLAIIVHMNSVGLVHRDVKVSNIMVRSVEYGGIVLVDYGFGNFSFKMDVTNQITGTSGYLAPELFSENTVVDLRYCDVFAIGIVAMSLLLGHAVFTGKEADQTGTKNENKKDRSKAITAENKACKLDWNSVADKLTETGLSSLQAFLHPDPLFRPLAEDALRLPWFDVAFEDCVPNNVPEAASRRLAHILAPRSRQCATTPVQANTPRFSIKPPDLLPQIVPQARTSVVENAAGVSQRFP